MRIFFHHGALGDWVLTLPLLRTLQSETTPVLVVAGWSKAKLAAKILPNIQPADIAAPAWANLFGPLENAAAAPAGVDMLPAAHLIVSMVSNGRDEWAKNIRTLAPAARTCFLDPRPPHDWPKHITQWHAEQLRQQDLPLSTSPVAARNNPTGPIVIHPGSGGKNKCWPTERFECVIAALRRQGLTITPILGEVELETWPQEVQERWRMRLGAKVLLSLDDLYEALCPARLFVGNDSGPTHLAAQIGVPTLALFGPTHPTRWRPIGPAVTVLAPPQPEPMTWLAPQQVLATVRKGLVDRPATLV